MDISEEIMKRLREAKHVVVFTGAGVSAESGIPTFRDAMTGLWENFQAQDLANKSAFIKNPGLVWGWYEWRRMKVLLANPNPAHLAIVDLAKKVPWLTLITQNVDDLHERAGSARVIHMHGQLNKPYCIRCSRAYEYPAGIPDEPEGGRHVLPPQCRCGGNIRPGVVWFGEELPLIAWHDANDAACDCDAFLCIGTSSIVQPAASLTYLAIEHGAVTVQVNPNPTSLDKRVNLTLHGLAGEVLPELVKSVWGKG